MRDAVPIMRELGIAQATLGTVTLVLGQEPRALSAEAKEKEEDPDYSRRQHYAQLLGRPVSNLELKNLP